LSSGEISVLDSGAFGTVTITKSMTISGDGALAGILASGQSGITITGNTLTKGVNASNCCVAISYGEEMYKGVTYQNAPGPVLVSVPTDYGKRKIRWIEAVSDRFTQELSTEQTAFAENAVAYQTTLSFLNGRIGQLTRALRGE